MEMIKVKFLRKSFLTPFGRFRTYIFSTFFVLDFPSRVTYLRAEMVYKLLKYKLFCSHKEELLYARERRTRAFSRTLPPSYSHYARTWIILSMARSTEFLQHFCPPYLFDISCYWSKKCARY